VVNRDTIFGPNRDDRPGITMKPGIPPAQLTDFLAESGVLHSRSQGWLPAVTLMLATDDDKRLVAVVPTGPELLEIICSLCIAYWRSQEDLAAGIADGTLK